MQEDSVLLWPRGAVESTKCRHAYNSDTCGFVENIVFDILLGSWDKFTPEPKLFQVLKLKMSLLSVAQSPREQKLGYVRGKLCSFCPVDHNNTVKLANREHLYAKVGDSAFFGGVWSKGANISVGYFF